MAKGNRKRREVKEDEKQYEEIEHVEEEGGDDELFYGSDSVVGDKTITAGLISEIPKIPRTFEERQKWQRLIVILEQATLQLTKTKKGTMELIN